MDQWALPTIAVALLAYGAVSGRLASTPVSQAMVFVALGLAAGNWFLDLVEADLANRFVRHLAEATLALVLLAAVLLGPALGDLDWRIAAYAVGSLTVVRMLPVAMAMVGTGMRRATVGFLGWFGPRGLASIVFLLILLEETELPERPLMAAVVTWTVALSVYAHGLTAWPGANRYADWYDAHHEHHQVMPESVPVAEHRPRVPHSTSGDTVAR